MNPRALIPVVFAGAVLGFWLPSLWLPRPSEAPGSLTLLAIPAPVPAPQSAVPAWQESVRRIRSPLALFQAVAAGVAADGASLARHPAGMDDLGCPEAEELARCLAGEALGLLDRDGGAFLKTLQTIADESVRKAALQAWAESRPDAALAVFLSPGGMDLAGAESALTSLAAASPDKTLALLKGAPFALHQHSAWLTVAAACAGRGPERASAALRLVPHPWVSGAVQRMLPVLAARDPRAALAWHESIDWCSVGTDQVYETWAQTDPATAFLEWQSRNAGGEEYMGYQLARAWAEQDPGALAQWVAQGAPGRVDYFKLAAEAMARRDPQGAVTMLPGVAADDREGVLREIGESWSIKAPSAALDWAHSLPEADRDAILLNIIPNLNPEDRLAAVSGVNTTTFDGFRALLEADPAAALAQLPELSAPIRMMAYPWVVDRMQGDGNLAAAAALAADVMQAAEENDAGSKKTAESIMKELFDQSEMSRRLANPTSAWATRDPAAAAAWAAQLPEGAAKSTAAANIAFTWGRYDLSAARAWAEQLPEGAAHDKAAEQITRLTKLSGE